jgi:hypothetical protein
VQRGKKNEKREDFLINLRRLTLVHEMIGDNEEVFRFKEGCVLLLAVISDTGTNLEVIDNISPSSTTAEQ